MKPLFMYGGIGSAVIWILSLTGALLNDNRHRPSLIAQGIAAITAIPTACWGVLLFTTDYSKYGNAAIIPIVIGAFITIFSIFSFVVLVFRPKKRSRRRRWR